MEKSRIENWANEVIERVVKGQPVEDSRIEVKASWVNDYPKTARQLAGHANASRGAPVLWLMGVDENAQAVPGVEAKQFGDWWRAVEAQFDGNAPTPTEHMIRYGDADADSVAIVAILFDTDAPPYVVNNPSFGQAGERPSLEVPWREGTATGTARRRDLLRILVPAARQPDYEPLMADLAYDRGTAAAWPGWKLTIRFYATPQTSDECWLPFHVCEFRCRLDGGVWAESTIRWLVPAQSTANATGHASATIVMSSTEVGIRGPGTVEMLASVEDAVAASWGLGPSSRPVLDTEVVLALAAPFGRIRSRSRWTFRCVGFDGLGPAPFVQGTKWRFVAAIGEATSP